MSIGTSMRSGVTAAINTLGSTIVLTGNTKASTDNGYSGYAETSDSTQSLTAAPYAEMKKVIKGKFGNLESGQFQLAIRFDAVIDTSGNVSYTADWQGDTYEVIRIEPYHMNDVLIAYIGTFGKRYT